MRAYRLQRPPERIGNAFGWHYNIIAHTDKLYDIISVYTANTITAKTCTIFGCTKIGGRQQPGE